MAFIINNDGTISPPNSPYMVWGIKKGLLVLVKNDADDKLIFDQVVPNYQLSKMNKMALIPSNHKGIAIVVKHGSFEVCDNKEDIAQHLAIGKESDAMSVFLDKHLHMLWSDCPSFALDASIIDGHFGRAPDLHKPVFLSTKGYIRHMVHVSEDGSIRFRDHMDF